MRCALLVAVLALAGCGGSGDGELQVFAASSLRDVLPRIDARAEYAFAGSDQLARQIREGAEADVLVAAGHRYTKELFRDRLASPPIVVATNRLVLVVPRANEARVRSLSDLTRSDVMVVLAEPSVPAGGYAGEALRRAGVTARVASFEDDVRGVLAKVALGEADAGIVYATDVAAAAAEVTAFAIDRRFQPRVVYTATVVHEGDRGAGQGFVDRLRSPAGRRALVAAGFGIP